jgi:hypothetical protein
MAFCSPMLTAYRVIKSFPDPLSRIRRDLTDMQVQSIVFYLRFFFHHFHSQCFAIDKANTIIVDDCVSIEVSSLPNNHYHERLTCLVFVCVDAADSER